MTSKKRRYGNLSERPLPTEDPALIDDVFAAFTGRKPEAPAPAEISEAPVVPVAPVAPVASPVSPVAVPRQKQTSSRKSAQRKSQEIAQPAAPARDFSRVANSILREAVAGGYFKGKSKQLYDYLYSQTRGFITPRHTARLTRSQIMSGAGIGSINTYMSHIAHLKSTGLIAVQFINGSQGGNYYTVYLPEEVGLPDQPDQEQQVYQVYHQEHQHQKLLGAPVSESATGDTGQMPYNSIIYGHSKTSFKTNTENDDDEAAATLLRAHKKLIEEITGREASKNEISKLIEVIEVITLEGKIAAARTTVSSAGPFLAEHLRRRLFKKNKQELAVETAKEEPVNPAIDVNSCPDCAGVGWYYPEGKEKGMAKCRHPALLKKGNDTTSAI